MNETDLRVQPNGVFGGRLTVVPAQMFAQLAVTEERSDAQVDEYLSCSRQTGSTFNVSAPFNCHQTETCTQSLSRPGADTPRHT